MNITDTVKLLELDEDLTFDIHMVQLGSYAVAQLNAISRLNRYLAKFEKASILKFYLCKLQLLSTSLALLFMLLYRDH